MMDEKDLRDCFAMFASMRIGVDGSEGAMLASAERCYLFADAMLEARNKQPDVVEGGIAAVVKQWDEPFVEDKPKRTYTRRNK